PLTILMGGTLPLLVLEAHRRGAPPGPALAVLYGANTLGAAAGALLGSFFGLAILGTRLTFLLAALLHAAAALAAWRVAASEARGRDASRDATREPVADQEPMPREPPPRSRIAAIVLAASLSGISGAALQIGWTRVAALAFGSTVFALGAVLFACI